MSALIPRMQRVQVKGQEHETITLDGEPILQVWPIKLESIKDGDSYKLSVTRQVRDLTGRD